MSRVALLQKEQLNPIMNDMFQKIEDNGFEILNLFRVIAHSPKIGINFIRLGNAILTKGKLSPKLRELAILRIGNISEANYEWTQHVPIALGVGVSQEQIDEISNWMDSTQFDDEERTVLLYTDEVAQNIRAADDTFSKLREFFNEEIIVELTVTIGYYCMVSRILEALQIELEE